MQNMLSSGKTLYVDDLVTDAAARSQGYGEAMLQWLIALAREAGCDTFSSRLGHAAAGCPCVLSASAAADHELSFFASS